MSWIDYTLKDLVTLKQGFALNKKSQHHLSGDNSGYPLLKISDLINGIETLFVKTTIPEQFLVTPSEIIYSRTGQVGIAFMGKTGVVYNNCFKVIPNEKVYSVFLFHWLNSKSIREHIKSLATGTAQPDLNHDAFKSVKINLPPLETQKRIASILSTYDDLIENNLKRIKLLEETAQNIYKEWFVNFRFPNYEHTEFEMESGLPVGWEMKKLSELNTKITDGTHDSPKPTENGYPLITGKNLVDGFVDFSNSYFISQEDHEKIKSRSYLDLGDIMYSNIGTVGSTAIVCENFEYSCKNVIIFKPLSEHTNFLYCFLTNDMNKKLFLQGLLGSNQKFISLKYARDYKFLFPTTDLISNFDKTTKPIFDKRRCLFEMNQKLKEARDILLPRLMNRTIEV
jgi:type I restriction enzyme S subunit